MKPSIIGAIAAGGSGEVLPDQYLLMKFNGANFPVSGDPADVQSWNDFFEISLLGFDSVQINGERVLLTGGGSSLTLHDMLSGNINLNTFISKGGFRSVSTSQINASVFSNIPSLSVFKVLASPTGLNFSIGRFMFSSIVNEPFTEIDFSGITNMTNAAEVFTGITGNIISLKIPTPLVTRAGILDLIANNTVTVTTV